MNTRKSRQRRGAKTKFRIREQMKKQNMPKLVIFKSNQHIYAQLVEIGPNGDIIRTSASTVDKEVCKALNGNKTERALAVGKTLAKRAKLLGFKRVAFDRSGYKFHGRVKALADGAREEGLEF